MLSVTKYSTVYAALRNFEDIRKQVNQQYFPVISDEDVDQIVMDIFFEVTHYYFMPIGLKNLYVHWEKY